MNRCTRPGCTGTIVEGYCDECFMAPRAPALAGAPVPATGSMTKPGWSGAASAGSTRGGSSTQRPGSRGTEAATRGGLGAGIVEVPPVPVRDPLTVVLEDPQIPESKRFCPACGRPAGRKRGGRPGLLRGHCTNCGEKVSFVPALERGDLVGGQYEVAGCLAHGGFGWVYLATDRNVPDHWVVLKGLINTNDEPAMAAAIAERRFLAQVRHRNIVRIYNFVEHDGAGYIVMEYIGGMSLKDLRRDTLGAPGPVPVARGIAYMLEALPALAYLHGRDLLYCDFKPDNLIQTDDELTIIDLGGVRRLDDDSSEVYGTVGYQAPEIGEFGPSVASDLYTVARTLAVMILDFPGYQDPARFAYALPPISEAPIFARYPALHRFLLKGTHVDADRRFQSATEMAEQLLGVLRQVVAIDGGEPDPMPSRLFSPDLGSAPSEIDWRSLPVPLVDPADPVAGVITALAAASPAQVVAGLSTIQGSPDADFQKVRALIELGDTSEAASVLAAADGGVRPWRSAWWEGVIDLADGRPGEALDHFADVAAEVPGELAPLLAMAVTAEAAGKEDAAEEHYREVAATDASYVTAAFGSSRILRRKGDRDGAAAALRRVPMTSSAYQAARATLVSVLTSSDSEPAGPRELVAASEALIGMTGDLALRTELTRDLMIAALDSIARDGARPDIRVAGAPLEELPVRQALERACRALAKLADTQSDRNRLIDQANAYRPRSLL